MVRILSSLILFYLLNWSVSSQATVQIGAEALLPVDPRQENSRVLGFRPGDGQEVTLNPPRISWPYLPDTVFKKSAVPATQKFTLQIAADPGFSKPVVEIKDTPYNFYNFLPPLEGQQTWYWRVGYNLGTNKAEWSTIREFEIAKDATPWDRSNFESLIDGVSGHPRILFNKDNLTEFRALQENNELSKAFAKEIIRAADSVLKSKFYRSFPKNDDASMSYMPLSDGLVHIGFAYLLTGDKKYLGFKERTLTMASWPPGGKSSPEGKGQSLKWQTHLTEHLGMLYDWFYDDWSESERAILRTSIEWRLDWTLNDFAWKQNGGTLIKSGSIAVTCGSHPYQNIMAILPGALAICDESPIAREVLECGLHYLIGVTNGHGEDEAWNDGPGYGNGKMKWLTNASWCLQSALPELNLGKNDAYTAYMDFFARLTPVGAEHSSFGNRGVNELDWASSRVMNSLRVAMLCNDGQALQNWIDTRQRLEDLNRRGLFSSNPYIDYVMPLYADMPQPTPEDNPVGLFPIEGWVSASSAAPSDYAAQQDAVSMVFACRPRGGTGHSFRNENAFDLHAYGETVAVGGGSTSNQSDFANDTMSHNTILVNGREQEAAKVKNLSASGRIKAFARGEDYVYWAGDATAAYGPQTGLDRFVRHVLFVDNAYFVIFDELAMLTDADPATFQWLYHVPNPDSLQTADNSVTYQIGEAHVLLKHLSVKGDLNLAHYHEGEGMNNRITGKDYRIPNPGQLREVARKISFGNSSAGLPPAAKVEHLWFSNVAPCSSTNFLAVIIPYKSDDDAPTVEDEGGFGVKVTFRGKTTKIAFEEDATADIVIKTKEL